MKNLKKLAIIVMALVVAANVANAYTGSASIGTKVDSDVTTNTTWTKSGSPYYLVGDIYVSDGAALTIEAGTVIASYVDDDGSLAVTQGADIYVMGTAAEPVIMTSANDVYTWQGSTGVQESKTYDVYNPITKEMESVTIDVVTDLTSMGDPKTGTWRATCQEWGSLAIMGNGYISASHYDGSPVTWDEDDDGVEGGSYTTYTNGVCPSAMNKKEMEGLLPAFDGDTRLLYGGDNDNDNSGEIHYLSLRYGGRDTQPNKELNGMSLGAVGRATDIDHVEVMNNVDDGIELWGGTVELSNITIWNIGDDSLDFDEGWRGSATNGLIVQGYCRDTKQGSGVGDNCIEHDGAEDTYVQPMSMAKISNFTVVGNSLKGDGGTAWRDNAKIQYDNCLWVGIGDQLVRFDNCDGDGALGYDGLGSEEDFDLLDSRNRQGVTGKETPSWNQHWTMSYNTWKNNSSLTGETSCTIDYEGLYEDYVSTDLDAPLCQITNSAWYDVAKMSEYDNLAAQTGADWDLTNTSLTSLPLKSLVRGATVTLAAGTSKEIKVNPVEFVNPIPVSGVSAGGFGYNNWLVGWTSAHAYGFTAGSADIDGDGTVGMSDLAVMSSQWLQ